MGDNIFLRQYRRSHFAPAFFFLAAERRMALQTLYAVCRVLDDAVDKEHPDPSGFLAAWREVFERRDFSRVEGFGQGDLARRFLSAVDRFGIPLFAMIDLIDKGVSLDLKAARFETPMDAEGYFYGVAGTVGLACLPIFGVPWEEGKDFAVRMGITVQSINCIRDVGADADAGRIYIPLDHLEKFHYPESSLLKKIDNEEFQALMRYEASRARNHYSRALELMPPRRHRELLPARIMGKIYVGLLDKLEKKGFPVLHSRLKLNMFEKLYATWQAVKG